MPLLDVRDVSVSLETGTEPVDLVSDVSFTIDAGETLCVVGESGSGKTVTALSIVRLLEYTAPVSLNGEIIFDGQDIAAMTAEETGALRGDRIGMVFQECMEALNPTRRIGRQLAEVVSYHSRRGTEGADRHDVRERAVELLRAVEIRDPVGCLDKYPHQLSGGMQQRVVIAMALMRNPALLIADEPTTALDVTVQAEILRLLDRLRRERDMGCLLITHDMGIAAEVADKIAVMYAGRLIEIGTAANILRRPLHPYTRGLLSCIPRAARRAGAKLTTIPGAVPHPTDELPGCRFAPRCPLATEICSLQAPDLLPHRLGGRVACWNAGPDRDLHPLHGDERPTVAPTVSVAEVVPPAAADVCVSATSLVKRYASGARLGGGRRGLDVVAVDDVTLEIGSGEFFGLVGETGSGKSTLGRLVAHLEPPTSGQVKVRGVSAGDLSGTARTRAFRRSVQVVFQNAHGSFDPRLTVRQSVSEPLTALCGLRARDCVGQVDELLASVGLPAHIADRRPGQLSGGQLQRVSIARAISVGPSLLVADEPTSALDVSVQAQVMNLLLDLRERLGLTYLFISHNLSLVLSVADRVGVMYLGALMEVAPAQTLAQRPAHPYTATLLLSNPDPDAAARDFARPEKLSPAAQTGTGPSPAWDGTGCRFWARCPVRQDRCRVETPPLTQLAPDHQVACHFPLVGARPLMQSDTVPVSSRPMPSQSAPKG